MDFHPVEQNLREMFRSLAACRGGAEVREVEGVTIVSLRATFQMFNAAFLSSPVADEAELQRRISAASSFMEARGLPWSLWICEEWLSLPVRRHVAKICQRRGLHLASEMPGMSAERIPPPTRRLPELRMRQVRTEAERREFCSIGSLCFRVPRDWFEEVFDYRTAEREGFTAWTGYLPNTGSNGRGQAVATAATVVSGGVIGLYNLAVFPEFQSRGYGESAMRYALSHAHERFGLDRVVLQSTRQAIGLYERLGFSLATRILVFTS